MNPEDVNKILKRSIFIVCAVMVAVGLWLVLLANIGYGNLKLQSIPSNAYVEVNGKAVALDANLRLRPGEYSVSILSPDKQTYERNVSVNLFRTTTLDPQLQDRSALMVVTSQIGASGQYGLPTIGNEKWFDNNTWLAGIVGPGAPARIALQYQNNAWHIRYFESDGYPHNNLSELPQNVRKHLQSLEAIYAEQ